MKLISCGESPNITSYGAHTHDTCEIVYQLKGEVVTTVGKKTFTLHEGEVMLLPAHVVHKGIGSGEFRDLSLRATEMEFHELVVIRDYRGEIKAMFGMIRRVFTERAEGFRLVADSLVYALYRLIHQQIGSAARLPAVEKLKNELYENLSNASFSLTDAVQKTGFDKDYIRRCFKRETGKTPIRYLTDLRLERACQLLTSDPFSGVAAVARSCGFADSLYFSTCFRKRFGVPPTGFRREAKKAGENGKLKIVN